MATNKEKLITGAQKLVERGSFDKAIKEYLKVVQEDKTDVRIWLKIGDLYAKLGKLSEATETYQRVAQFYSDQGFYLKSVAVYMQILKINPRLVDVNIRLAELYKQLGLFSDATQQFEAVAAFFQKEGRLREALAAIKQIVELDPEAVANRIKLAELYSKEQMPREATEEFSKAAEQLRGAGRIDDFMKVAERLLFHSPENRPITKELARLYIKHGEPRRALPRLQVLFKADHRDVEVLGLLASAFESLDQRPKAVSVMQEQARILGENGDQRGRADVARKILALSPGDPDAEAILAGVRFERQSAVSKRAHSSTSARVASSSREFDDSQPTMDASAGSGLDALHPDEVDFDETDSTLAAPGGGEEAISKILNETDVYAKYNLHAKAIEHLQRVFERNPRHQLAREKLKALYLITGKREEAVLELWALAEGAEPRRQRRYLREILDIDPHNVRAAERLGELPSPDEIDSLPVHEIDSAEIIIDEPTTSPGRRRIEPPMPVVLDSSLDLEAAEAEPEVTIISAIDAAAIDLDDELDEADFFMQQRLFDEARAILMGLRARHPIHSGVEAKLRELESQEAGAARESSMPFPELLEELADSLTDLSEDLPTKLQGAPASEPESAEQLLETTRRGVIERGVSAEDFETHYDLGIAYKEMGLLNEAISEFRLVMKDRAREVQCHLMVGLCYLQKEMPYEAIAQFKMGLNVEGINDRESMTLYFELGQAYEQLGDAHEALYYYDNVHKRDPHFRDVERRVSALRGNGSLAPAPSAPIGEDVDAALDSILGDDA